MVVLIANLISRIFQALYSKILKIWGIFSKSSVENLELQAVSFSQNKSSSILMKIVLKYCTNMVRKSISIDKDFAISDNDAESEEFKNVL